MGSLSSGVDFLVDLHIRPQVPSSTLPNLNQLEFPLLASPIHARATTHWNLFDFIPFSPLFGFSYDYHHVFHRLIRLYELQWVLDDRAFGNVPIT